MNDNFVKVALYAYPMLRTIGEDYEAHIKNMAILSYRGIETAEETVERIARTILEKRRLEQLKETVEKVLDELSELERTLLSIRYFGGTRKKKNAPPELLAWSESKYFRKQARLFSKVSAMMKRDGLTEERFEEEYAQIDIFERVYKFVAEGKDCKIGGREKKWLKGG